MIKEFNLIDHLNLNSYLLLDTYYNRSEYYKYYDKDINEDKCISTVIINPHDGYKRIILEPEFKSLRLNEDMILMSDKLPFKNLIITPYLAKYYMIRMDEDELNINSLFNISEDNYLLDLYLYDTNINVYISKRSNSIYNYYLLGSDNLSSSLINNIMYSINDIFNKYNIKI